MNAAWIIVLGTAVIVLLGTAVIVSLALNQRSRKQWRERIHDTSEVLWHGASQPVKRVTYSPRTATFAEVWNQKSAVGSAYFELPRVSQNLEDQLLSAWKEKHGHIRLPQSRLSPTVEPECEEQIARREAAETKVPVFKPIVELPSTEDSFSYTDDGRSIA